jgi:prolipoprotein diacylglyceryltransferase
MIFGWYGLGRLWIEGLRTDSLYLFGTGIRTSQLLAGLILAACLAALIYFAIKKPNKEFYVREVPAAVTNSKVKTEKKNAVSKNTDDNFIAKFKKAINKLWQK